MSLNICEINLILTWSEKFVLPNVANQETTTALKVSKYGVCSGTYFPVFSPNAEKYGQEKSPYLGHFSRSEYLQ